MLRIPDPVVDPLVGGLVADVLERLAERTARTNFRSIAFADDVTALAADRLDDLFTAFGVAMRRVLDRGLVLVRVGEEIGGNRADLSLVARPVLFVVVVRVVPEARHPRRRLHGARIANPVLDPVGGQLR